MSSENELGHAPQQRSEETPLYVIVGWIRRVRVTGHTCELCGRRGAHFTYVGYSDARPVGAPAGDDWWLFLNVEKAAEAQKRGVFLASEEQYLCAGCMGLVLDLYMGSRSYGNATVVVMLSPLALRLSCVVVERRRSDDQETPRLLYTDAQTIDELLPQLRQPGVRSFVFWQDEKWTLSIEQEE
jgi:hypothetical protein